jgi:hypothetical protein
LRIAIAVKLLVIEAMRKTVSGVTGVFVAVSCTPAVFTHANSPSMTMPKTAPGILRRSTQVLKSFSISGKAAASFFARSGSAN